MTDVQDSTNGSEPSMEEILASIRRIIADEKEEPEDEVAAAPEEPAEAEAPVKPPVPAAPEPAPEPEEDALELTQAIKDDGSVEKVVPEPAPAPEPESEIEMAPIEETPAPEPTPTPAPAETLVSDDAAASASASLANLADKVEDERKASMTSSFLGNGDRTLEGMVMELMKPMLKSWLDDNLPAVVDRLVQKEVERIARKTEK